MYDSDEDSEFGNDEGTHVENMMDKLPTTLNVSFDSAKRFNFLVAGPAGAGKSTFCTRLLKRYFPEFEVHRDFVEGKPTSMIEEIGRCEKVEGSTRIIITVIDTPGFGESMNSEDSFDPIEDYIVQQNRIYESKEVIRHPNQQENDTRIHCCFYFLAPHRVTEIDGEFMKRMENKVPIVPVVAKADTMTIQERMTHLKQINDFLNEKSIQIFDFKEEGIDSSWLTEHATFNRIGAELEAEGENIPKQNLNILVQIPNVFELISGQRRYMWGVASEDDLRHSDTQRIHRLLFHDGSLGRLYQRSGDIHESWRASEDLKKMKIREIYFRKSLITLFFVSTFVFSIVFYFGFYHSYHTATDKIIQVIDEVESSSLSTNFIQKVEENIEELLISEATTLIVDNVLDL